MADILRKLIRYLTMQEVQLTSKPLKNICDYCETPNSNEKDSNVGYYLLCDDCFNAFENKTGHCSLDCCISGRCDESC